MFLLLSIAMLQVNPLPPETWKERNHPDMPILPACDLGNQADIADSIASLPKEVSVELARFSKSGGGISEANGPYNGTDVVDGSVPTRRFIRAYHVQNKWIVWYEHGGLVTGIVTLGLELDNSTKDGRRAYRAMPGTVLSGDLCAATKALLAGVRSGNP
ncbi:hypothetical protein [Sphingomonas sp. R86521]|uniref:hypothetical protein n=1 Tax=Sphingomonas sp. R86521 TaxID=3093860 RepID=UPI0036D2AEF0